MNNIFYVISSDIDINHRVKVRCNYKDRQFHLIN